VRRLELLALGLYWWCPVAWWACRSLQAAEEECCDAWVVWALPGAAEAYATALVETVAFVSRSPAPPPVGASGAGHVPLLKRRLSMILLGTTPKGLSRPGLLLVLFLGAGLLPLLPSPALTEPAPGPAVDKRPAPAGDVVKLASQHKSCVACHASLRKAEKRPAADWKHAHDEVVRLLVVARAERDRATAAEKRLRAALARLDRLQKEEAPKKRGVAEDRAGAAEKRLEEMERALNALLKEVEALRKELNGKKAGVRPRNYSPAEDIYHTNARQLQVPIRLSPDAQKDIKALVLNVSVDGGRSWREAARRSPEARNFDFTAERDGEYWFSLVTVFKNGRREPVGPGRSVVGLKVRIDTVPPRARARLLRVPSGKLQLAWAVEDTNLDLTTLRAEYRAAGQEGWSTLDVPRSANGTVVWAPEGGGAVEVRLTVKDKAGNEARKSLSVRAEGN
jgi:hypothetical protein